MASTSLDKLLIDRRTDDVELIPLGSPTTRISAGSTTGVSSVPIGFRFKLDGVGYTTCYLSPRGFVRFAGTVTTASNAALFASSADVMIAPWYDATKTADSTGYVKTEVQGTKPYRRCVIEWLVYGRDDQDASNNDLLRFQVVLYESTGRFDLRYAARVRTGSVFSAMSASVGFKADTSTTTDNYRDLSVDDLSLGGSKTASATGLVQADYDALATIVVQPNWPMVGRHIPLSPRDLDGIQRPNNDPAWAIAQNVNWSYCQHRPALVCLAPTTSSYSGVLRYVVPIEPSADGLEYDFEVITYSSAGGDLDLEVSFSTLDHPQPADDPDWTTPTTESETGTSAGYHDWPRFTLTIDADVQHIRFELTPASGQAFIAHILVTPKALTEIDPTATYPSGFVPMAIGQITRQGAAVHPEWYNRAWRNLVRVARDRKQALWSFGTSTHVDQVTAPSAGRSVRIVGVAPASLRGWRGYETTATIFARDTSDGAVVTLSERGGVTQLWGVDANAGEYRRQRTTMRIASEEPLLIVSAKPALELRTLFVGLTWVPPWADEDLIRGVTPAPKLEALITLISRATAMVRLYALTGLAVPLERGTGSGNKVVLRWQVGPATQALRAKVVRISSDPDADTIATSIYGASSGLSASDKIVIANPVQGRELYPWDRNAGEIVVAAGGEVFLASPTTASDRLLESPTETSYDGPESEKVEVTYGAGMTLVPYPSGL